MTKPDLTFDCSGVLVLPAAFDATGMADALWGVLSRRYGMLRDDAATWKPGIFGKLTKFGKSGRFASVATAEVTNAVASLLGAEWHETDRWGAPLITFPMPGPWEVPHGGWHIDFSPMGPLPAVRMFAYLSHVRAGGGGTVVVTGSHLLAEGHDGVSSAEFRSRLAQKSEWFRDLWRPSSDDDRTRRYMTDGAEVDGVDVRVVELTGEPGDVVLWHPALLHAIAPNCLGGPRFMLTNTAYRGTAASDC